MQKDKEFYTVRGYQIKNKSQLTTTMEDHLEMIYRICIDEDYARINQLATKLNIKPSSATKIVGKLVKHGLVDYQKYGIIKLTKEGLIVGKFLLTRHKIIEKFLINIDIEDLLLKDTEMMEHFISYNTLKNIYILNEFFISQPHILEQYKLFKNNFDNELFKQ